MSFKSNTTLNVYSHSLIDIDRLASDTLEKYLYAEDDDFKIPNSLYPLYIKDIIFFCY